MEQNELIMQAARLINEASTECRDEHTEAANAKLVELHMLLTTELSRVEAAEPEKPEAPEPT